MQVVDCFTEDIITDLTFEWGGKRLATASTDRKVRFYRLDEGKEQTWKKTSEILAHDAAVTKVKWAHPDFGNIFVTCSFDKSFKVFEEKKSLKTHILTSSEIDPEEGENWVVKHRQFENIDIEDIKLAPKHLGLIIAAAYVDGKVRLFEAADVMNLNAWKNIGEIQMNGGIPVTCISWSKNSYDAPMMVLGGRSQGQHAPNINDNEIHEANEAGEPCLLSIFHKKKEGNWGLLLNLDKKAEGVEHRKEVYDASWALLNGKSFHNIVSCGSDGLFVWYVKLEESGDPKRELALRLDFVFSDKSASVRKAAFNFFGTAILTNGDDNTVRFWKSSQDRSWTIMDEIKQKLPNH